MLPSSSSSRAVSSDGTSVAMGGPKESCCCWSRKRSRDTASSAETLRAARDEEEEPPEPPSTGVNFVLLLSVSIKTELTYTNTTTNPKDSIIRGSRNGNRLRGRLGGCHGRIVFMQI